MPATLTKREVEKSLLFFNFVAELSQKGNF
jgi:hypothetical protein